MDSVRYCVNIRTTATNVVLRMKLWFSASDRRTKELNLAHLWFALTTEYESSCTDVCLHEPDVFSNYLMRSPIIITQTLFASDKMTRYHQRVVYTFSRTNSCYRVVRNTESHMTEIQHAIGQQRFLSATIRLGLRRS